MSSDADFSKILELMDVKRLHEEQQEKWNIRLAEKDERLQSLKHDIEWRRQQAEEAGGGGPVDQEIARLEEEKGRLMREAQERIQQLNQRLGELKEKLGA